MAWRAEMDGTVVRLVVADETVYAGSGPQVSAFDAATGEDLWSIDTGTPGPFRVADGVVYATGGGHVRAIDARTGAERWRFRDVVAVMPAAAGGRVCVIGRSPRWGRTLHVLNARNGVEKWRLEADLKLSAPATDGDLVMVGHADGLLQALRARNGRERWRIEPDVWHPDWPERGGAIEVLGLADDLLYLAGLPYDPPPLGFAAAVDVRTGRERWQAVASYDPGSGLPGEGDPPTAEAPGGVCFGEPGRLTYMAAVGGPPREYRFSEETPLSPPVMIGGLVCAGTAGQLIEAFDAATGRREWVVKDVLRPATAPPPPLAVWRDRLLVGGHRRIYHVDPRTGAAIPV
ncbi:PQQ-like beta-propeller repeat protein [Thermomonospora umbrina]|uniref:PQQ enzyme-like repeat protein n=1 Tax=Thermomonospora umbrina TaxID=111806 RepID=A0A3D9T265_9ACTN|nr:PQQ-like beta-propeller repeat protein [Thermomonospora umbrina]REE99335.1 PQQ enzyme-like repeat protein [Thermomonospora umbrina]